MNSTEMGTKKIAKMFGHRFIAGSWSAFAALICILIAVILNLIVEKLPSTVTQIDLTGNSLYTLSAQTNQIVSSLDKDVKLYLLAVSGNEDPTISRFLSRYAALSDHIKVENIDLNIQPTFLKEYDLEKKQIYQNSVIVDCGGRHRLVGTNEIFVTQYSMNNANYSYDTTTTFEGEKVITNAIHYVSNENLPKIYVLKGHGEEELPEYMTEMMKRDNMTYDSISLLSLEAIPEDAAAILINAPSSDLGEDETKMLMSYVAGGGNVVLLTDYIEEGKMPNLLKVTQVMGLTVRNGIVIEGNHKMHLSRNPHYLLPKIASHTVSDSIIKARYYILAPIAQAITKADNSSADITWLLTTSKSSYAKLAGLKMKSTDKEKGDADGPFNVGAISVNGGKMLWITSANLLNIQIDRAVAGGNSNLVLNTLNWMGGQEKSVSIRAKSVDETRLTIPASSSNFWSIVMIGVIPVCLISIGMFIYIRRKRQ